MHFFFKKKFLHHFIMFFLTLPRGPIVIITNTLLQNNTINTSLEQRKHQTHLPL